MAGTQISPTSVILPSGGSGSKKHGAMGERGIASIVIILIIAILGIFGFGVMAAINWKAILAIFAAGIIAMAVAGALFFKAKWEYVMICSIIALAIVFIIEVTFPMLVGGLVVMFAMWNFKSLGKKPIWFFGLILLGLGMMLFAKAFILVPLGMMGI